MTSKDDKILARKLYVEEDIDLFSECYHGVLMRSKLEVKWAKYFDLRDFDWMYEPERFDFGYYKHYTPDFKVRCHRNHVAYIEVKGSAQAACSVQSLSYSQMLRLGHELWICIGDPCVAHMYLYDGLSQYHQRDESYSRQLEESARKNLVGEREAERL